MKTSAHRCDIRCTFVNLHMERVQIPVQNGYIEGTLTVPPATESIVVFAHGSGSSRRSLRNRFVAEELQQRGFATLLFDLLTKEEEEVDLQARHLRFDIALLAQRLSRATQWVAQHEVTASFAVGYFGASTGSAAALTDAMREDSAAEAIVSRGGRPDLAEGDLGKVRAPTLLIVGERDAPAMRMNRSALDAMTSETRLEIVAGATHLFEEAGALEEVARLAGEWFERYLM